MGDLLMDDDGIGLIMPLMFLGIGVLLGYAGATTVSDWDVVIPEPSLFDMKVCTDGYEGVLHHEELRTMVCISEGSGLMDNQSGVESLRFYDGSKWVKYK